MLLTNGLLQFILSLITDSWRLQPDSPRTALRRELCCRLSVRNLTHSQLVDLIPTRLSRLEFFQDVLNEVASFEKPKKDMSGVLHQVGFLFSFSFSHFSSSSLLSIIYFFFSHTLTRIHIYIYIPIAR